LFCYSKSKIQDSKLQREIFDFDIIGGSAFSRAPHPPMMNLNESKGNNFEFCFLNLE